MDVEFARPDGGQKGWTGMEGYNILLKMHMLVFIQHPESKCLNSPLEEQLSCSLTMNNQPKTYCTLDLSG